MNDKKNIIIGKLKGSAEVKLRVASELSDKIATAAEWVIFAFKNGGKILLAGNGGSAADAQHIATEFVGGLEHKKNNRALPAIALTTDTSVLTAIGNDLGYEFVFARQMDALAGPGADIFIAISTSGNSQNIIKAVEAAKAKGVKVIAFLGKDGGKLKNMADLAIVVPSDNTQRIQESHITIGHIICELTEAELFS